MILLPISSIKKHVSALKISELNVEKLMKATHIKKSSN